MFPGVGAENHHSLPSEWEWHNGASSVGSVFKYSVLIENLRYSKANRSKDNQLPLKR